MKFVANIAFYYLMRYDILISPGIYSDKSEFIFISQVKKMQNVTAMEFEFNLIVP